MVQSAIFVPGISVTNNNTRLKNMDMRKVKFATMILAASLLTACGSSKKEQSVNEETAAARTQETENLLANLKKIPSKGIMLGHHDDTVYGIGWEGEEGRSDVKSVCGDYPAVISFDLGELELGNAANLDKVPFDKIRKEIINQYQRGGMVSLSWHARNPKTGGDAWDVSDTTVVKSILPGGENHQKFAGWLGGVADFLHSLKTADGVKIPVLFRPWHEHSGSWFWWGEKLCTPEEYKALWHMTVDTLQAKGVDNALYAYSPGTEPKDTTEYLKKYPGDELIDVIGFDTYQFDRDAYLAGMDRALSIIDSVGKAHNKVIAVTETGYEGIPDAKWWTGTLLPALEKYPLAYVLVWRNAREKVTHYYAPYPGQTSAEDFVEFYNNPKTLFAADVNLYQ
ncbi:Mannan endo-1,4-beta-mannosidase [Bacteroides uniformis]|nr:Mannan endo-1,4-beta-mannosidase [Bacteroides uniformis]